MKDVSRANCKGVVAASLDEVKAKAAEKFGQSDVPNIHLDSDGTEIDDEDYFQTLEPNTELVAVFNNEQWIDVSTNNDFQAHLSAFFPLCQQRAEHTNPRFKQTVFVAALLIPHEKWKSRNEISRQRLIRCD